MLNISDLRKRFLEGVASLTSDRLDEISKKYEAQFDSADYFRSKGLLSIAQQQLKKKSKQSKN